MADTPEPNLFDEGRGIFIAPVRHHSPACAMHLAAMIDEIAPAMILIEGPGDYDHLIPLLTDAATVPPVAIVAITGDESEGSDAPARAVNYFPFCAHSPEFIALATAAERGIRARFIDLPSTDKAMLSGGAEMVQLDERPFDSGTYVRALAERLGCRDGNEAWDHLFETRLRDGDWRRFFADVGLYCAHMREATAAETMAADGTLAREEAMIAHLAAARREVEGPIVVVVGGFHSPPLAAARLDDAKPVPAAKAGRAPYLIRYGYRQLNALTGYGAGLPLPAYYAGLWDKAREGSQDPYGDHASDVMTRFSAHLRESLPGAAPPLPVLVATLENAHRLAALRGRPGPLRDDLLDAARSTLLKGEEGGDMSPVMAEFAAFLTGSAIGDVPLSAGSPPLVEAVRARARALGLRVDDGERRARELDIYRKPRHREISRFLHANVFLESGFAQRTGGPDFRSGVGLDRLIETWTVMWSPLVEARLIERAADGDSIESVLVVAFERRMRALEEGGQGGDAGAAIDLFAAACQAGIGARAGDVLRLIETQILRDADLASVAAALRDLIALWRGRAALGLDDARPVERLIGAAWRRALFLLPDLKHAGEDRIDAALDAMVVLREVVSQPEEDLPGIDAALFDEAVAHLLDAELAPALAGAVAALALLAGRIDEANFAGRLRGELMGAHPDLARRVAWLRGVIAISRELLWRVPDLIAAADETIGGLDDDDFAALLPHLRIAFNRLDPREIDRLAQEVAGAHGGDAAALTGSLDVSAAELDFNLRADRDVAEMLKTEGLA